MQNSIRLQFDNLSTWAKSGRLQDIGGREIEFDRLKRILQQPNHHHALILGEPGSGKTAFIEALAWRVARLPRADGVLFMGSAHEPGRAGSPRVAASAASRGYGA